MQLCLHGLLFGRNQPTCLMLECRLNKRLERWAGPHWARFEFRVRLQREEKRVILEFDRFDQSRATAF